MEHILDPTPAFDFSQLTFVSPTSLSGGNYFIRILTSSQLPFYIQPPKCSTKSAIQKSGKKMLCDLIFKHEDESFLEFLESLEEMCHTQIFNNREKWFEAGLTKVDIENCFVSPTKSFKSGKMHILRTNVPIRLGKCNLKIFNEKEQMVDLEDIRENTSVATILEIQGIRCSARNFQIEFEIKQMMVLKPTEDLFEKCMFGKALVKTAAPAAKPPAPIVPTQEPETTPLVTVQDIDDKEDAEENIVVVENVDSVEDAVIEDVDADTVVEDVAVENEDEEEEDLEENEEETEFSLSLDKTSSEDDVASKIKIDMGDSTLDTSSNAMDNAMDNATDNAMDNATDNAMDNATDNAMDKTAAATDMCEITLDVLPEEQGETVKIKNPNEAYYEMYKEAKRKAKIARDLALASYLSAKQIKYNYLSGESFSDDDEMDAEEKELNGLDMNGDV